MRKPSAPKPRERKPALPFNPYEARCELAMFDIDQSEPCAGLVQRCHLVPNQWLRDELGLDVDERWHQDFWMQGCEHHHRRQEQGRVRLERRDLPARLEFRAIAMSEDGDRRLEARLDRDYGLREQIGRAA
jgi:hypothetical protein